MEDINKWLEDAKTRCARLSEAYRLELGLLWWVNLILVVTPAVASTAAAVIAAIPEAKLGALLQGWPLPPASILAGSSAILVAIHKSLKCEEFQAECLRLAQEYQAIAEGAAAALARPPANREDAQVQVASDLAKLTKSGRARLPSRILWLANRRFKKSKLLWLPSST